MTVLLLFAVSQAAFPQQERVERCHAKGEAFTKAECIVPSAEEAQITRELNQARIAGDHATAMILQSTLDQMNGVTMGAQTPSPLSPPILDSGTAEEAPSGSFLWIGDILITDPAKRMAKPSLTSAPNGDLYAAVENLDENIISVYKSTDGGMSWHLFFWVGGADDLRNPSAAYAEKDNVGVLYVAFEVLSGSLHGVNVLRLDVDTKISSDTYVEWGFTMLGSEQVYPELCTDYLVYTPYYVYVTYAKFDADYYPVYFSRSMDYGVTFSTPWNVTGGAENSQWPTRPDVSFGHSGLFIAYEKLGWNGSDWETQPWVLKSNNAGSTFVSNTQLVSSVYPGYHPSVAAAPDDDTVVVAFTKEWSSDSDVNFVCTTDGGSTWSLDDPLPGWTYEDEFSVDLCTSNANGRFHAVHHQDTYKVRYTYASCDDPTYWDYGMQVNDTSTASAIYSRPAVCVNPLLSLSDEACVAWSDFRSANYGVFFDMANIPPLTSDVYTVSAGSGGVVNFDLDAGMANGFRNYLLLGSVTGTEPGIALPGGHATLPINWDAFTDVIFAYLNTPLFSDFMGVLNAAGQGSAQLTAPAMDPIYVGLVMHFAFCVNDPFDYASNPLSIEIAP
jgi:hypothetical protein